MPYLFGKEKDRTGGVKKGEYEAPNEAAVRVYLRGIRLALPRLVKKEKAFSEAMGAPGSRK